MATSERESRCVLQEVETLFNREKKLPNRLQEYVESVNQLQVKVGSFSGFD